MEYRHAIVYLTGLSSLQRRGTFVYMSHIRTCINGLPGVALETQEIVLAGLYQIAGEADVIDLCDLIGVMLDIGSVIDDRKGWTAIYWQLWSQLDTLVVSDNVSSTGN